MQRFFQSLNILSLAGGTLKAVKIIRGAVIAAVVIFSFFEAVRTAADIKALKSA